MASSACTSRAIMAASRSSGISPSVAALRCSAGLARRAYRAWISPPNLLIEVVKMLSALLFTIERGYAHISLCLSRRTVADHHDACAYTSPDALTAWAWSTWSYAGVSILPGGLQACQKRNGHGMHTRLGLRHSKLIKANAVRRPA